MLGRPLIFGEVLFDRFPDGSEVLGGAPVNVAWHLQGFGLQPLLISRVGTDMLGRRVVDTLTEWGMDLSALQRDEMHPTGQVSVRLENGQPSFDILSDQAYDFIDGEGALRAIAPHKVSIFYHGTLALRSTRSRAAYQALTAVAGQRRCVDVNLRPPWTPSDTVNQVLTGACWVKVNDLELAEISGAASDRLLEGACQFKQDYGLSELIVTRGEAGALWCHDDVCLEGQPVAVREIQDTVGAGDAFSSVALLGLIQGWDRHHTLQCALEFAALVCGIRGATIPDVKLYRQCLDRWSGVHVA